MAALIEDRIEEKCHARVGLIGNPSDGFQGKTLSFLIKNFSATVIIEPNPTIEIIESAVFQDFMHLTHLTKTVGYNSGGLRLLQATCKVFGQLCSKAGINLSLRRNGFRMSFSTTIPRMVGLSGSSAIITAAFNGLLRFYNLTIDDLQIPKPQFPEIILSIERDELGISAGLQDRVIQTYGGLVHMDFTKSQNPENIYRELNPSLLPELYLIYNTAAGGDSGKVHSTVKERWANRDPELVAGMQELGKYADEAVLALEERNYSKLGHLMESNFAMRRRLYSDAVVGEKNIEIAMKLNQLDLYVKFTGSGGAFIGLRKENGGWFSEEEEQEIREELKSCHFEFLRIEIP